MTLKCVWTPVDRKNAIITKNLNSDLGPLQQLPIQMYCVSGEAENASLKGSGLGFY